ncbi:MAG: hypothetical protein Q8O31_08790 [Rhodocyclaceae bacterium]|nr:hypothetical protein [Rhodocyclaceae bacterium]
MKNRFPSLARPTGFILLTVSVALIVLGTLMYSLSISSGLAARTGARAVEAERARLLAEAGLAHALRNMQMPYKVGPSLCTFNETFSVSAAAVGRTLYLTGNLDGIGSYQVAFVRQPNDANGEPRPLLLQAMGTLTNGAQNTVSLPLPALTFALPGWSPALYGITATAVPIHATWIDEIDKTTPHGNAFLLEADGYGNEKRILLNYDFTHFPGMSNGTGRSHTLLARLGLYQDGTESKSGTIAIHRVRSQWDSSATWNKRNATANWSTPGGDFDSPAFTTVTYRTGEPGMRWIELPASNFDINLEKGILIKIDESLRTVKFRSHEYSTDKMFAPRLEIVYIKGC